MKTAIILDSEFNSSHPLQSVLDRRGFVVLRAGTPDEAIKLLTGSASVDLVIAEVPLSGSVSQTDAAVRIHGSSPEIPILLVSSLSLDQWPAEDFQRFGQLLSGRVDLIVKPLSQASFVSKVHALLYTITYTDSRRLFEGATAKRQVAAGVCASA